MRVLLILLISVCLSASECLSQVDLQTGAPQFSIPVFNYADPKNKLSLGISLDYLPGNGIRVSDVASCVGTGWILNAGGYIIRKQNGEPDDQNSESLFPSNASISCSGTDYLFNTTVSKLKTNASAA